jgi:hypothetical protein
MTTSTLTQENPSTTDTAATDTSSTDTSSSDTTATAQLPDMQPTAAQPTVPIAPTQNTAPQNTAPASPQYNYPPVRPTNVLGIITLVLGVLGFAIVPVITGHIALAQIKRTGDDGRGITIAGLVLGYIGVAGYVFAALLFFGALFLGFLGAIASY